MSLIQKLAGYAAPQWDGAKEADSAAAAEGLEALLNESSSDGNSDSPRHTPELRPQEPTEGEEEEEFGREDACYEQEQMETEEAEQDEGAPSLLLLSSGSMGGSSGAEDYIAGGEDSASTQSDPASPRHRFHGHPLGRRALEMQQEQVACYHNAAWEERVTSVRHIRWSAETSAARAKVLVAEAFFLERRHLRQQLKWLNTPEHLRRPTKRFRAKFHYPSPAFGLVPPEIIADPIQHRKVVEERLSQLEDRWQSIYEQVECQMRSADEFPEVIRNLSTMRIFLEGQQARTYGIDVAQQQRRMMRYQQVLDEVAVRADGYFLRDALPSLRQCPAGHLAY
eukprot:Hpha_TRINITY_DN15187_c5_g3::TRINITY_DN15187_c5_g3_i1::g.129446::m.129446